MCTSGFVAAAPLSLLGFLFEDQNGVMLDIPDERDQNGVMLDIPDYRIFLNKVVKE